MTTSFTEGQIVQPNGGVYFEIKDPVYINNLRKKLHKLRRYRWIYHRSAEYYEYIYDYYCFYPQLILGIIVAILSMLAASYQTNSEVKNILNYIVAGIGFISTGIQTLLVRKNFNEKYVKFSTAAKELDKLIIRVSNEVSFNDEDPNIFVKFIENALEKIKGDLDLNAPLKISMEYDKIQNSSDTDSEDETFNGSIAKYKNVAKSKRTCYDYDIEDDLKAQREYEKTQNALINNSSYYVKSFVPDVNDLKNNYVGIIHKPESAPTSLRQKSYIYTFPNLLDKAKQPDADTVPILDKPIEDNVLKVDGDVKVNIHPLDEEEYMLNADNKSNLSVESTIKDDSIITI
jgi:hypothetical protein